MPDVTMFVLETVELELSLTTVSLERDEPIEDNFSCPIKLHRGIYSRTCLERQQKMLSGDRFSCIEM